MSTTCPAARRARPASLGLRALVLLACLSYVPVAGAQPCLDLCGPKCVKPWALVDRWDDSTPIPGYDGSSPKLPLWSNNGRYDHEAFTDLNGNGLWDAGEPYVDRNGNGRYDEERYDPALTGYIAGPVAGNTLAPNGDLGSLTTLQYANSYAPTPGGYVPIDLPPINRGTVDAPVPVTGQDQFRANIATCNQAEVFAGDWLQAEPGVMVGPTFQGIANLIAEDPNAYWDPITGSVQGSAFETSPRVVILPLYDPRTFPVAGRTSVRVAKLAAFFLEQLIGNAQAVGRFTTARGQGAMCAGGPPAGGSFLTVCPRPIAIDIRPGACPNMLNPRARGVLPVAVLGARDLDVSSIDPASIRLAGVAPARASVQDVGSPPPDGPAQGGCDTGGPDGVADLLLRFDDAAIAGTLGDVARGGTQVLTLTCALKPEQGGDPLAGQDEITIPGGGRANGAADPGALTAPDPFRPGSSIGYVLAGDGRVRASVYDVRGRRVATLVDEVQAAGPRTCSWDGRDARGRAAPSGVYFVRLETGAQSARIGKLVLAR